MDLHLTEESFCKPTVACEAALVASRCPGSYVSLRAGDARKAMIASQEEYLLAGQGGGPEGIIFPQNLLAAQGPDIPLGDLLRKIPVFDSSATASDVLSAMKEQGASTALVFENGRVIGLVVMDEIVRLLL